MNINIYIYDHMLFGHCVGDIFPFSILGTSKLRVSVAPSGFKA